MNDRIIYRISIGMMMSALLLLGMNWLFFPLPDSIVRVIGVLMMTDLVLLSYLTAKEQEEEHGVRKKEREDL